MAMGAFLFCTRSNLEERPAPDWPAGAIFEFWARSWMTPPYLWQQQLATMDGLFGGDEVRSSERDDRPWQQRKTAVWREWQPCSAFCESFHLKVSLFRRARVIAQTFSRLFALVRARVISLKMSQ
jgi:hypothetical protein